MHLGPRRQRPGCRQVTMSQCEMALGLMLQTDERITADTPVTSALSPPHDPPRRSRSQHTTNKRSALRYPTWAMCPATVDIHIATRRRRDLPLGMEAAAPSPSTYSRSWRPPLGICPGYRRRIR